jgi:hypothetical protein
MTHWAAPWFEFGTVPAEFGTAVVGAITADGVGCADGPSQQMHRASYLSR